MRIRNGEVNGRARGCTGSGSNVQHSRSCRRGDDDSDNRKEIITGSFGVTMIFVWLVGFGFQDKVFLCKSPGCPSDSDPPASTSHMLGLKIYT